MVLVEHLLSWSQAVSRSRRAFIAAQAKRLRTATIAALILAAITLIATYPAGAVLRHGGSGGSGVGAANQQTVPTTTGRDPGDQSRHRTDAGGRR
jgi:p-aminobenzoyl-glutamate transporter AbgT